MLRRVALILLLPVMGYSQSLEVSAPPSGGQDSYSTFGLQDGELFITGSNIHFVDSGTDFGDYLSYGVAPDYDLVGALKNTSSGPQTFIMTGSGDTLSAFETGALSFDDPSLGIYTLGSGSALVQNNIANFTLYNPVGSTITSASGSSGSEDGEAIAEVAMDTGGKTFLIYTPLIRNGSARGSQAHILQENHSLRNIFYSDNRELVDAGVSEDGQFVYLITASGNSDREVLVMDRFGNRLNRFSIEDELIGAAFSGDASLITLYSSGRVLVYSTLAGERVGSTSFRSSLVWARYFTEDQTIIALTGSRIGQTDIIQDLEFHAINLDRREIARQTLSGAIGTSPNIDLRFEREGSGRYRLTGASREVTLEASF